MTWRGGGGGGGRDGGWAYIGKPAARFSVVCKAIGPASSKKPSPFLANLGTPSVDPCPSTPLGTEAVYLTDWAREALILASFSLN